MSEYASIFDFILYTSIRRPASFIAILFQPISWKRKVYTKGKRYRELRKEQNEKRQRGGGRDKTDRMSVWL